MQGEHEILCCGTRVKICGKRIRVVSEPKILRCPLNETLYGFKSTNKDTVKKIVDIRKLEKNKNVNVTIFSVCNMCATEEAAKYIADADIVCASASKIIREHIGSKALMQIGVAIPIFVLTKKGKRIVLNYLSTFSEKTVVFRSNLPYLVVDREPTLKE
ncbi:DUF2099 family protein [Candidatus Bathyarchaeota archaeon]|nr:MAG: DUF2099 family protein [Candidatus Bathyarchaeota archaeon]